MLLVFYANVALVLVYTKIIIGWLVLFGPTLLGSPD